MDIIYRGGSSPAVAFTFLDFGWVGIAFFLDLEKTRKALHCWEALVSIVEVNGILPLMFYEGGGFYVMKPSTKSASTPAVHRRFLCYSVQNISTFLTFGSSRYSS